MKTGTITGALLLAALLLAQGCFEDTGGGGVTFSASTRGSSSSPSTKTVYGSIDNPSQTSQTLSWAMGDRISIYSPQAAMIASSSNHFADYLITDVKADASDATISRGTVTALDGNGLQWGSGTNYFYAVYPSTGQNEYSTIAAGGGNAVTATGTIPATQTLEWTGSSTTNIVGAPDMDYAYMYASASASSGASSVELSFTPKFTAFQFEIGPGDNESVHLTQFTLSTSGSNQLAGTFAVRGTRPYEKTTCSGSASLEGVAWTDSLDVSSGGEADAWGDNEDVSTTEGSTITVSIDQTLTSGHTLTLTVLALPQTLGRLTISFTGEGVGTRSLELKRNGAWLNFAACKKYRIYGLSFPLYNVSSTGEDLTWDGSVSATANGDIVAWTGSATSGSDVENVGWGGGTNAGSDVENVGWGGNTNAGSGIESVTWTEDQ